MWGFFMLTNCSVYFSLRLTFSVVQPVALFSSGKLEKKTVFPGCSVYAFLFPLCEAKLLFKNKKVDNGMCISLLVLNGGLVTQLTSKYIE